MQAYIESIFHHNGLPCVVVFRSLGYRCGYVGVPKDHDCYLKDDNELDIDCHWGLTYSGLSVPGVSTTALGEYWWLGFDCSHAGDARDYDALRKYFKDNEEVIEAADRWEKLDKMFPETDATIKDLDYAIGQCKSIAEQLCKPVSKTNIIQQVIFEDLNEEPGTLMGGIMLENGDVICGCCGGILEKADEGVTWKLIEKYDNWVDIDDAIRREENIDNNGIT